MSRHSFPEGVASLALGVGVASLALEAEDLEAGVGNGRPLIVCVFKAVKR